MLGKLRYVGVENPGEEVTLTGYKVRPLGYDDLVNSKNGAAASFPLHATGAKVMSSTVGLDQDLKYNVTGDLENSLKLDLFCLVPGGWLPPGMVMGERVTYILDRNAVSILLGEMRRTERDERFISFLDSQYAVVDPLMHLFEDISAVRGFGDVARLVDVNKSIAAVMPKARQVPYATINRNAFLENLTHFHSKRQRYAEFFLRIAKYIEAPVSRKKAPEISRLIAKEATTLDLHRHSFAFLAAISSILVPNGKSPAKLIIKPKRAYTKVDAYNAASDITALEILLDEQRKSLNNPVCFCTGDRALTLFWSALRPVNLAGKEIRFFLSEDIFPNYEALFPELR